MEDWRELLTRPLLVRKTIWLEPVASWTAWDVSTRTQIGTHRLALRFVYTLKHRLLLNVDAEPKNTFTILQCYKYIHDTNVLGMCPRRKHGHRR